ncbi:MAG TPA: hypothetical protein VEL82_05365 [Thermoplasmata archaeon]|nr:hypothetical protein [Thermoplasmata archaeon]
MVANDAASRAPEIGSVLPAAASPDGSSGTDEAERRVAVGALPGEDPRRWRARGIRNLELSAGVVALLMAVLALFTALASFLPGFAFGAVILVQSPPLLPPVWSSASPTSPPTPGIAWLGSALAISAVIAATFACGLAFRGLHYLRRAVGGGAIEQPTALGPARYLLLGSALTAALYFLALVLGVWLLAYPSSPSPASPAGFVSADQSALAELAAVLAFWFFATVVLVALFQRAARTAITRTPPRGWADRSSLLMIAGATFYFAIIATPFWNATPFWIALYLAGAGAPEGALVLLPGWLFLAVGFGLGARGFGQLDRPVPASASSPEPALAPAGTARRSPSLAGRALPHRAGFLGALVVVAVVVLATTALYAAPSAGGAYGELEHSACVAGTPVAREVLWTPQVIINSPFGGTASGTITQIEANGTAFQQTTTWARNGTSDSIALALPWTIYRDHTDPVAGAGADAPCAGPYLARPSTASVLTTAWVSDENRTSDAGLPQQLNVSPEIAATDGSVLFSAGFTGPNEPVISNCPDGGRLSWTEESEYVHVDVPFDDDGVVRTAGATMDLLTNYTYATSIPGTFYVENLGELPDSFGSGLAFDYIPC